MAHAKIIVGNVRTALRQLEEKSVQTCITSPPYFGLRDYGTGTWVGGNPECSHKRDSKVSTLTITGHKNMDGLVGDGIYKDICPRCGAKREDEQIGLEQTPQEFVQSMVEVFREVWRVLKDDGTLWLNLGDTYSGVGQELKPKNLVGIPWRVAFALQEDGWNLRQDIIWAKPNPMPESVTDRCTKSHEYIFLLSKNERYFYDNEAIKEPTLTRDENIRDRDSTRLNNVPGRTRMAGLKINDYEFRNKRDVWTVATKPYAEAHFAVFPEELIEPCVLAGSKEGDLVLDPFTGSGTTAIVALKHNRNFVGTELNPEYAKIAENRIIDTNPMFDSVEVVA